MRGRNWWAGACEVCRKCPAGKLRSSRQARGADGRIESGMQTQPGQQRRLHPIEADPGPSLAAAPCAEGSTAFHTGWLRAPNHCCWSCSQGKEVFWTSQVVLWCFLLTVLEVGQKKRHKYHCQIPLFFFFNQKKREKNNSRVFSRFSLLEIKLFLWPICWVLPQV